MRCRSYPSNTYIESYGTSKFIDLTSRKGNPNGPQQGNGRNRRVTDREPSFRARSIDRKDGTRHEEQLSSKCLSVIRSSSATTGTHANTPPLPAKKSGTGVLGGLDGRYSRHFVRERAMRGEIKYDFCSTYMMLADYLTKILRPVRFKESMKKLGVGDTDGKHDTKVGRECYC